jgi:hypothetical protein
LIIVSKLNMHGQRCNTRRGGQRQLAGLVDGLAVNLGFTFLALVFLACADWSSPSKLAQKRALLLVRYEFRELRGRLRSDPLLLLFGRLVC